MGRLLLSSRMIELLNLVGDAGTSQVAILFVVLELLLVRVSLSALESLLVLGELLVMTLRVVIETASSADRVHRAVLRVTSAWKCPYSVFTSSVRGSDRLTRYDAELVRRWPSTRRVRRRVRLPDPTYIIAICLAPRLASRLGGSLRTTCLVLANEITDANRC